MNVARTPALLAWGLTLLAVGCGDDSAGSGDSGMTWQGTREQLMDPQTCNACHPKHYREWSSSMHAYAGEDPVFIAMNARGQRETGGELGDFCVGCHAPMAVREGLTTDGLNLDELPDAMKGVTCYFCHNAVEVTGTHNAALRLANDTTMRGGIDDPVDNAMHGGAYSTLLDSGHSNSSNLCGACHDIVTPAKVELERTFKEWRESIFSKPFGFASCGSCHMDSTPGVAADDPDVSVPARDSVHEHLWPGVDVALTEFPYADAQLAAVQCALSSFVQVRLCPFPDGRVEVLIEANAGHKAPSGAAQDRRMWLELVAFDEAGEPFWSTGDVADDEVVDKPEGSPGRDRNLWVMRDRIYDDAGNEVHMFWEATRYESLQLPTVVELGVSHSQMRPFNVGREPARLEARVKIRPMDFDVLQDLVDSKDLNPAVLERLPTFVLASSEVHWSRDEDGYAECVLSAQPPDAPDCPNDYRCLLDPDGPGCDAP